MLHWFLSWPGSLVVWLIIGLAVFVIEWPKITQVSVWQRIVFFFVVGPLGWLLMGANFVINWRDILGDFLLFLFCWSGTKLFKVVSFYSPDEELIRVIHFACDEDTLKESCEKLLDDMR